MTGLPREPAWKIGLAITSAALLGWMCGPLFPQLRILPFPDRVNLYPEAWRMPAYPGMGSLRLVMIHDVLHERFQTHGPAFHEARIREALRLLPADGSALMPEHLPLIDDLGVSLDRLGRSAEAVAWFTRKVDSLQLPWPPAPVAQVRKRYEEHYDQELADIANRGALTPEDHQRYTTYANLGTVLIHAAMANAMAGDEPATKQVELGLAALRASVAINPGAHFGRERWQIILVEHLLASRKDPKLKRRFDGIGSDLITGAHERGTPTRHWSDSGYSGWRKVSQRARGTRDFRFGPDFTEADADQRATLEIRPKLRMRLIPVGADHEWVTAVGPSWTSTAAWDQPVLGAIGLWTLGGGASPHLALILANTCERIGERHLAIEAWLRLETLADTYSKDAATVEWLRQHIRTRLDALATSITGNGLAGVSLITSMRAKQQAELAWALDQRRLHHAWEAERLAAGLKPGDPALNEWWKTAPKLASDPGDADELAIEHRSGDGIATALLGGGIGAWLVIASLYSRRSRHRDGDGEARS